jgi:hypothetical protein
MRHAIRKDTAMVLITPPAKIGSVPYRLPISATRISGGTSAPGIRQPARDAPTGQAVLR